ncbi:Hsp33 family molecular chaperone HslO [Spartinivicinus ruber]|uniref:Hsp33 family molecular chaperone HslO n=1 Tax=Spartinivicinus ruber TaxID=2683272 RepID=UPI0013D6E175|nr:Hsp33 family molecular chaperone HslO [Spartinivicinus ruber]
MSNTKDIAQRFSFDNTAVRGEIVSLEDSFQQALVNHDYPPAVRQLLGELIASAILLSSTLKFEGTLTLQARSEGPVTLLMAECNEKRQFRAVASWQGEVNYDVEFSSLMPKGVMSITIDPKAGKRYQGVVPTHGATVADCLAEYFQQSEQLPTRFWMYADQDRVSGMLLQALPNNTTNSHEEQEQQETWQRINCLADTITPEELLSLDFEDVLHRLFHEETVRLYDPQPAAFKCSCSKGRTGKALLTLGYEEVASILQEQQRISMNCQFCGAYYEFSAPEVEQLFDTSGDDKGAAPVVH